MAKVMAINPKLIKIPPELRAIRYNWLKELICSLFLNKLVRVLNRNHHKAEPRKTPQVTIKGGNHPSPLTSKPTAAKAPKKLIMVKGLVKARTKVVIKE